MAQPSPPSLPPSLPKPLLPPLSPITCNECGCGDADDPMPAAYAILGVGHTFCGDDATILITLVPIMVVMFIIAVILYLCLFKRLKPKFSYNKDRKELSEDDPLWRGPKPPTSAWAFIPLVLRISDDDFLASAGLDALSLIIAIRGCIKTFLYFSLWSILCIAVNVIAAENFGHDNEDPDKDYPAGNLAKANYANVVKGDWSAMAANVISMLGLYLITFLSLYFLRQGWWQVIGKRQEQLVGCIGVEDRAVLVTNPPLDKQTRSEEEVLMLWKELYPNEVISVQMIRETGKLGKLQAKHEVFVRKLELMDTKIAAKGGAKKGCCGGKTLQQKRDALQEKLKEINSQLLEEHAEFSAPKMNCGANYLVLLRSFRAAAVATSIRCHGVQGIHKVERAPVPHDLNYKSLEASAQMATFTKKHIFQILFVLLVIFYLIPIVAVGMVLTAENLSFLTPVFDALGEQGTAAFVAFLPQLGTIIFMAILPDLMLMFASSRGYFQISRLYGDAFNRLFLFYYLWFFLGYTISASAFALFDKINDFADDPMAVLSDVGNSLASLSTFFVNYLIVNTCWALPFKELTLTVPFIKEKVKRKLGLQGADVIADEEMKHFEKWTKMMYAVNIGLCYACISPYIMLFVLPYLAMSYVLYARNTIFFYTNNAESGGRCWPTYSGWIVVMLYTSQLVLLFLQGINGSPITSALCLLPLIATYLFSKHAKAVYVPAMELAPLLSAMETDAKLKLCEMPTGAKKETAEDAESPAIRKTSEHYTYPDPAPEPHGSATEAEQAEFAARFSAAYKQKALVLPNDMNFSA